MPSTPLLFDRSLLRQRRSRATALGPVEFLIDRVAGDLADRLATVLRRFAVAVDLATPTDALQRAVCASGKVDRLVAVTESVGAAKSQVQPRHVQQVVADAELLPFREASLDLVVSGLALQFVNDLPGTLIQIRRALKPDGLFVAALLGGATLTELRQAFAAAEAEVTGGVSPRVAPFVDIRELGSLLQRAGFALPVTDVDRVVARYDHAIALMHDLRRMGATNSLRERRRVPLTRAIVRRAGEIYADRFADADGRIRASFEIVWLSGWAPHESQQQPLRPGSAQARLADALNAREQSAGEKAGN